MLDTVRAIAAAKFASALNPELILLPFGS